MILTKRECDDLTALMGHMRDITDKDIESLERVFKIANAGRHYEEDTDLVNAWLTQWDENPEYDTYKSNEVELLEKGNMLFLIPKEDRKPIKVIIA